MLHTIRKIIFIALIIFSYASLAQTAHGQKQPPPAIDTSEQDLDALVQVLENPQTRDAFIQQLKGLTVAQTDPDAIIIKEEGAILLHNLADNLESLAHQFDEITEDIINIPTLFSWILSEAESPERRAFWEEVFRDMLHIIGGAYLLLYLSRRMLNPIRQKILLQPSHHKNSRAGNMIALSLLNLLPLCLFALTAYFLAGLIDPSRLIKLLVAAWVNAIIIANLLAALIHFSINADYKNYNLLKLNENTVIKCHTQLKHFLYFTVYGYFILQSAIILKFPHFIFEILNLFFSAIVAGMLIFWVFQHRGKVAKIIRGNPEKIHVSWLINIRNTLADIWPWIALAYIMTIFLIVTLEIHHGVLFIVNATLLSLLVLTISFITLNSLEWLMLYFVKLQKDRLAVAPGFETQVKSYFIFIKKMLRGIIYLVTLFSLLSAWNIHPINWLWFGEGHFLTAKILRIFSIALITFLIWVFCVSVIEYYLSLHISKAQGERTPRARSKTLLSVSRHFLAIILVVISSMLIISEFGVNIGPLLAGAGVLGLAIGFGSQRLVQDVINGIFILLDDTISVDDIIITGGKRGVVEAISIRTMRLRDVNGDIHTIPFSAVETITNQTKHYSYAMFTLKVGHHDNIDAILDAIKAAGATLQKSPEYDAWVWDAVDIFGIDSFTEYGLDIKGRIKTAPGKQGEVLCEFNRLVKIELDKRGISWPYQQLMQLKMTPDNPNPP